MRQTANDPPSPFLRGPFRSCFPCSFAPLASRCRRCAYRSVVTALPSALPARPCPLGTGRRSPGCSIYAMHIGPRGRARPGTAGQGGSTYSTRLPFCPPCCPPFRPVRARPRGGRARVPVTFCAGLLPGPGPGRRGNTSPSQAGVHLHVRMQVSLESDAAVARRVSAEFRIKEPSHAVSPRLRFSFFSKPAPLRATAAPHCGPVARRPLRRLRIAG